MNDLLFRRWLEVDNKPSAGSILSCARRVEADYGDLDRHFEQDELASLFEILKYTQMDLRQNRPNPTSIVINGNIYSGLASCKSSIRYYRDFRRDNTGEEPVAEAVLEQAAAVVKEYREGRQFDFESTLQASLRAEIAQLEAGLEIVDDGTERRVESGNIDILARDSNGSLVVIELKRGTAKRDSVGQILGYMGDLKIEDDGSSIRGLIIAADFDVACRSATAVVPSLTLRKYEVSFRFSEV